MTTDQTLLKVYLVRHQESIKEQDGSREYDAPLDVAGRESARNLSSLLVHLGDVDSIASGTLSRQIDTARIFKETLGESTSISMPDRRLNAIPRASFLESPGADTAERDYHLEQYKAGSDGLCHGVDSQGMPISFNPENLGIYPFDKFVCRAHLNRRLRDMIFPNDRTLERVEEDIGSLSGELLAEAQTTKKPISRLVVGSGSTNALLAEYARYGTIGEHLLDYQASRKSPIFTQKPDQLMVLGYTTSDLAQGRDRLKLIENNIDIDGYVARRTSR